jgi:serine/arginine repetitive matrix protein 2
VHESTDDTHPPRSTSSQSKSASSSAGDGEEEDWDRIDSASDLDASVKALGIKNDESVYGSVTIRGKGSPYLQDGHHNAPPSP